MRLLCSILCLLLILGGCSEYGPDYKYTFVAKVTYTNGDIDTLNFSRESFNGNEVYHYLKISESGVLSGGGTSPCLILGCGFYQTTIVCGVRKYIIISEDKTPLK